MRLLSSQTLLTKILGCLLIIFFLVFTINACQKGPDKITAAEEIANEDAITNSTATFNYSILPNGGDTILQTSMSIGSINYGALKFKANNVRNKDSLSAKLSSQYNSMLQNYGVNTLKNYSGIIERMLVSIGSNADNSKIRSLVFQSLCIYNTLSKAADRDSSGTGGVNFTLMESYLNGISSFSVEEDEYINIPAFKQFLNSLNTTSADPGIDYYLGALANETAQTLNMVQITQRLETYFAQNQSQSGNQIVMTTTWPEGDDCGCCGNYEGPCLFWSKSCLVHDFQCQTCIPRWYCFGGV